MSVTADGRCSIGFGAAYQRVLAAWVAIVLAVGTAQAATLLHYEFNNTGGTTATDLSGNGRDGTLNGFVNTAAGAGAFGVSEGWVTGGGLSFLDDADRSYVTTPLTIDQVLGTGSFTIELKASADGPTGWAPLLGKESVGGGSFWIGIDGFGGVNETFYVSIGDIFDQQTITKPWSLPGNQSEPTAHHLAVVFTKNPLADGGMIEVFVDGTSGGTFPVTAAWVGSSRYIRIGNAFSSSDDQWDGIIYGVAFSDQALTPASFLLVNPIITLNASVVAENQPVGTAVGTLGTVGDTGPFTYTLVSGTGDTDNAYFQIVSNTLQTAARFDYEAKSSYSIRVRSVGAKTITNVFAIAVTDVVEDYMMIVSADVEAMTRGVGTVRTSGDYASASYVISGGADADKFEWASAGSPELQLKAPAVSGDVGKKYYVEVTATDSAPTPKSIKALIETTVVNSKSRGMILIIR